MPLRLVWVILLLIECGTGAAPQDLEVASIRPHASRDACKSPEVLPGGTIKVGCYTLELILREALNISTSQLQGGPGWLRSDNWDIIAKSDNAANKTDEEVYRELLLAIAKQRFHVRLRTQPKEVKGLALVRLNVKKLGPSIHPTTGGPHLFEVISGPRLSAHNVSMQELAKWLTARV